MYATTSRAASEAVKRSANRSSRRWAPGAPGKNGGASGWMRSPCLGQCERAPAVLLTVAGEAPRTITLAPIEDGVAPILAALRNPPATTDTRTIASPPAERGRLVARSVPQVGQSGLRLLGRIGSVDPTSLDAYRANDGYRRAGARHRAGVGRRHCGGRRLQAPRTGWRRVSDRAQVGRGGEGRGAAALPRMQCRRVGARDVQGSTCSWRRIRSRWSRRMTIAGYATGCERGYLYLRGEYPLAAERMAGAIAAARSAGLLGADVMRAGFTFDIEIRRGAGAYICGEETALFNSIEGKRGEPRNKPPFPVQVGLFGTPHRRQQRRDARQRAGAPPRGRRRVRRRSVPRARPGPKLFCVSGRSRGRVSTRRRSGSPCGELLAIWPAPDSRPRRAARRRGRRIRRPGRSRRRADLRGNARDRGARSAQASSWSSASPSTCVDIAAPHCRILPRRVVRPVRAVPRRDGPPGGAPRAAPARRPLGSERRRRWRCSAISAR